MTNSSEVFRDVRNQQLRSALEAIGDVEHRLLAKVFAIDSMCWQKVCRPEIVEWLWCEVDKDNVYDPGFDRPEAAGWPAAHASAEQAPDLACLETMRETRKLEEFSRGEYTLSGCEDIIDRHRRLAELVAHGYAKRYTRGERGQRVLLDAEEPVFSFVRFRAEYDSEDSRRPLSVFLLQISPSRSEGG